MKSEDPRKTIIEVLKKHPEGLTIVSLASLCDLHRHTTTKYIHELLGAGIVLQRTVGVAKLCYLCQKIDNKGDEKKLLDSLEERRNGGKIRLKVLAMVAIMAFLMSETVILAYNNTSLINQTNFSNISGINTSPITASSYPDSSQNLTLLPDNSTDENPVFDDSLNSTENFQNSDNSTVELIDGIIQGINDSVQNTANHTDNSNSTDFETQEQNNSEISDGETGSNYTSEDDAEETPQNDEEQQVLKDVRVSLVYPDRITRGDLVTVIATVLNADTLTADNVVLDWTIPAGFELVTGEQRQFCGAMEHDVSCIREITLKTDVSTVLGTSKVRVVVSYE